MDEATLRAALDERGLLRADHGLSPPDPKQAYRVFSQRADARWDAAEIARSAERFFGTTLSLVIPKRYGSHYPDEDAALVSLSPSTVAAGARLCWGRRRSADDLHAAERADAGGGLYELARRCEMIWLVSVESEADRTALLLSAVLASVMLGPILSPGATELFGVRTARLKLEEGAPTYRR